jgi:hypothetical protein
LNIYEVILDQGDLSNKDHYILAKDFDDACQQAKKLRDKIAKDLEYAETEIIAVTEQFELELTE